MIAEGRLPGAKPVAPAVRRAEEADVMGARAKEPRYESTAGGWEHRLPTTLGQLRPSASFGNSAVRLDVVTAVLVALALLLAGWGSPWLMLAASGLLIITSLIMFGEHSPGRSHRWATIMAGAAITIAGYTALELVTMQ